MCRFRKCVVIVPYSILCFTACALDIHVRMSLQIGGIRITFLLFIVYLVMCLGNLPYTDGESTNVRPKRDFIKETADVLGSLKSSVKKWLRARKAKKVL